MSTVLQAVYSISEDEKDDMPNKQRTQKEFPAGNAFDEGVIKSFKIREDRFHSHQRLTSLSSS